MNISDYHKIIESLISAHRVHVRHEFDSYGEPKIVSTLSEHGSWLNADQLLESLRKVEPCQSY